MNNLVQEVLREYEMLRDKSLKEALMRRQEVYKKIPEISNIDDEIKDIGIEISKSIFLKPQKHKDLLENLRSRLNALKKKKADLLRSNGYPETYMEQKFECNICKDTGYVNNKRCKCFEQKLINLYYRQSSIEDITKIENFSNFDYYLYSDKPYKGKMSPRENMKSIVDVAKDFIDNFDNEKESLFFYGDSGLGKTFLSNCIAKELLDRGKVVLYRTAPDLIEGLRLNKLNSDNDSYFEYTDLLRECDLLIIDDLGTEPITPFSLQEIFSIVNARLLANKKFIISTNLPLSEVMNIYPERLCSRILGNFKLLNFYGEDIRIKRKTIN
ncbi:DNA replication protein [Thermoanaerobacterium thermosaccharolyticum]|uniref:DNA replication protein n=3 Tax=Thermoanaerobacterium thermosaccharolyticum TaxID=1517 RepID=A0A231VL98_THETR|nr:ATP-binding protein [Thermoanaerobacterium thermosaccharolyticum]AGB20283.1 DNA replication protein [Thermoanaerobacterium thermosaccharolyticum M0795]AST57358.1 DNA replication protein [Thermoanaerobacterium thermosaccharolyticum]OXT08844.1 DNA replication protein DnaC [Thermoanaerobacterium thermosaccharolyticum]